jgi:hypothetical protein
MRETSIEELRAGVAGDQGGATSPQWRRFITGTKNTKGTKNTFKARCGECLASRADIEVYEQA